MKDEKKKSTFVVVNTYLFDGNVPLIVVKIKNNIDSHGNTEYVETFTNMKTPNPPSCTHTYTS